MKNKNFIIFSIVFLLTLYFSSVFKRQKIELAPIPPIVLPVNPTPDVIKKYEIKVVPAEWLPYENVIDLLKVWNKEVPELTEFGTYGKSKEGKDLVYFRTGTEGRPKILIHACLHGNERLATGATLYILQKMLFEYGRNEEITKLLKTRNIYWVPMVSPDTYLESRHVEGVDPNRNYNYPNRENHTPVLVVKAIQDFHLKHQFKGVISGHTYGEVYLWPSFGSTNDMDLHKDLAKRMGQISGYDYSRISNNPNGYEIDFYYWKGATAILTEFGSGTHEQKVAAIKDHGEKNYKAYMLFIDESVGISEKLSPPKSHWSIGIDRTHKATYIEEE